MSAPFAARVGDAIAHGSEWAACDGVGIGPIAGAHLLAQAIPSERTFGIGGIVGGALTGSSVVAGAGIAARSAATPERDGEYRDADDAKAPPPCSHIVSGWASVVIEGKNAAALGDLVDHGNAELKEGSASVEIHRRAASRRGDLSTCGGRVVSHATRTVIGGRTTSSKR